MKKLIATTAMALALSGGAASAQSVLERVLGTINDNTNMQAVNGIFANIAENIGTIGGGTVYTDGEGDVVSLEDVQAAYEAGLNSAINGAVASVTIEDPTPALFDEVYVYDGVEYATEALAEAAAEADVRATYASFDIWFEGSAYNSSYVDEMTIITEINGSITNVLTGLDGPTADVGGVVMAVDQVTVELGDMATTVLGAVNTGDITLGVNQDVSEAIAGSSSAVSNAINQLGGSVDTSALVLNVASNATSVIGSVNTTMTGLDATMGSVATTVLGAVNTGTITSGVNAAVNGIQSGIVGTP